MTKFLEDLNDVEALTEVDATPNDKYPIRILEAHLHNTKVRFATNVDGSCDNPLYQVMNKDCEKRAIILCEAIAILKSNSKCMFKESTDGNDL